MKRKEELEMMASFLLGIVYDTDEWEEDILDNAVYQIRKQLEILDKYKQDNYSIFDTGWNLIDILDEVMK